MSWAEFLEFTLVAMKKVDYELIDELQTYFRNMDVAKTGELSRDDLVECARRKLKYGRRKLALAAYYTWALGKAARFSKLTIRRKNPHLPPEIFLKF